MTPDGWTDERIDRLRTLWAEGVSCTKIAEELKGGLTRNAVIGKVHRLGLSGTIYNRRGPRPAPTALKIKPTRSNQSIARSVSNTKRHAAAEKAPPAPYIAPTRATPDPALLVSILYLQSHHCRWIVEDGDHGPLYCGSPRRAAGIAFCAFHAPLAFQPAREARR